jgi:hypothetical protein
MSGLVRTVLTSRYTTMVLLVTVATLTIHAYQNATKTRDKKEDRKGATIQVTRPECVKNPWTTATECNSSLR